MPNLNDCLQTAIDGNAVNRTRAQQAQAEFQELSDRYASAMPRHMADAKAAADIQANARKLAQGRRHMVLEQIKTMQRNASRYGNGAPPTRLVQDMEKTRFDRDGLARQFHGMIGDFLKANYRTLTGGVRDPALLRDIVRELHGQASGSRAARAMSDAIKKAQTRARTLFNAHGGDIGELADYGISHSHDVAKLRGAGFDAWKAEIADRLDWSRIPDATTGRPFAVPGGRPDPIAAEAFLRRIYENITTRGWNKTEPAMSVGGRALYNKRADHRVLHFKDADEWMAYNEAFGASNPFDTIVSHFDGMARDIALMRNWGPNPRLGLEHAIQVMRAHANRTADAKAEAMVESKSTKAKAMLAHLSGAANHPAHHGWAAFLAGTRNILTGAQLGSATLSAVSDLQTQRLAAAAVGMNANAPIKRAVDLMASKATRETAAAMGYVADTLADAGSASARYLGDVWSPEITERISSFVLRANGLSYWTDMNRLAFQMEFAAHLAQNSRHALADMDPKLRQVLEDAGITSADWDLLRNPAHLFTAPNGSKFLSPLHWLEATNLPRAQAEGLSLRLQSAIEAQMEYAVPSVSLEGRTSLIGDQRPGTFGGEFLRSTAMYKNFALSLTLNQYRRLMAQPTGLARTIYGAQLIGGMWVMGAVAVQLKELAKGHDPRPMDNMKFWGSALAQSGGLGIFGDFFASETSRAGGGLAETLAGPVAGLAGDMTRAVASNVSRAAQGKSTLIGRDVSNLARRYTPGSTIWYWRAALDRAVWDNLQDMLDPEARQQWRQQSKRRAREYGNQSWWGRGQMLPDRGPDLANMGGG